MVRKSLKMALIFILLSGGIFSGVTLLTAHRDPAGVGQVNLGLPAWLIIVPKGTGYWSTPGELAITRKMMVGSTLYVLMLVRLALAIFLAMALGLGLFTTGFWIHGRWNRSQASNQ